MNFSRRDFVQLMSLSALNTLPLAASASAMGATGTRPFFIDSDTASDDAVALMLAFAAPDVEVVGIGTVAGNQPVDKCTNTAIYIRGLYSSKTPVHRGAAHPLIRTLQFSGTVHGQDGMGDVGLPIHDHAPDSTDAAGALIEAANKYAGRLELVTLGPLTNVATALLRAPEIAAKIKSCVIMGGVSDYVGNVTPVSEFNIWADPEAVSILFQSGVPIKMVGWDISRKYAVIDDAESASIRAVGTERARVAIDCQTVLRAFSIKVTHLRGPDLPDPIAMAVALQPAIATQSREFMATVLTGDGPTRGMIMYDQSMEHEKATGTRITVVTEADHDAFVKMLREAVR